MEVSVKISSVTFSVVRRLTGTVLTVHFTNYSLKLRETIGSTSWWQYCRLCRVLSRAVSSFRGARCQWLLWLNGRHSTGPKKALRWQGSWVGRCYNFYLDILESLFLMHREAKDRWCTFMMPNLRQIMLRRNRMLVSNQKNISLEFQMPFVCHFIIQSQWNKSIKKRRGLKKGLIRTNQIW